MRLLGELAAKPGTVDLLQASVSKRRDTSNLPCANLPSSCLAQAGLAVNKLYGM